MKKSRFTENQAARSLGESDAGKGVREGCKVHEVSEGKFYAWKRKCASTERDDPRRPLVGNPLEWTGASH